jgi:NADPH:quinone reductase
MKEAIVDPSVSVKIIDSPVPVPGPGEVLIKVVISGTDAAHPIPVSSEN